MTNALLALLLALGIISTPDMVREMSIREGVNPRLSACIVTNESNWDTNLIGAAGEIGLMQIMPDTGKWAATKVGLESYDLHDPVHNLTIGMWILREYPEFYHTMYLCEGVR